MTDLIVPEYRICILDDDPGVLQSLQFRLEAHGFSVRPFRAAVALLTCIDPDNVDCLVVDYKMPQMDGLIYGESEPAGFVHQTVRSAVRPHKPLSDGRASCA